ncbi:myoferlin-like isoform X3 [Eriocheir sinensis]|uniref:myoferlin-like isoform X3 n=1 Tax=Eriocheir sinensis TaxID=95602 RepID=UPI0021C6D860|nr:myoferlin-like isoform X3 [Eriocheir sinensis]
MALEIKVVSASSLQNLETLGKSDPYVTVNFQGDKKKTETKSSTLDPVWEETLRWELSSKAPRADECIDITVKDYERIGRNRLLGKATIALRNVVHAAPGTPLDYELGLLDASDSPTVGTLKLVVSYTPPAGATKGGAAAGAVGGGRSVGAMAAKTAAVTSTLSDGTDQGQDYRKVTTLKDQSEAKGISPMPDVGVEGVTEGMPTLMPQQRHRDRLSNVKTSFQVRVRVVEGRQLLGANMNPVSRVSLDGQTRQTRVHKGTTTPWFDEIFFFQAELLPTEFLEKFLEFKVCNSCGIRSSTTIGAFKCEVGMVYDQPEHAILNRWLVLADPDEATPTVQGYLKVSVAVLGPGDMCPDMIARQSEQDDVEANLLWSAGVHLQPATFVLSVYCAQNLPQMDAGTMQTLKEVLGIGKASKELVDPYLMASYAGREVQTKIMYTNESPEFRQNLYMGFLFPSMCNVIKIVLKDWDRVGDDDTIGTATIPVSAISAPGEDGYLPTFGPAWVSVYGTRREWELLESDASSQMNKGLDVGCAYRGRVLLSLHTQVGAYPPAPTTAIDNDDFNKVRRFRGTRKFVLVCQLSGAWLLESAEKPLELEVSVGNFGNKLENKMLPSPSSTHPANPVFDGCKYYFLPWSGVEPFVTVHCDFEDVTHRLHCANHIISITNALKKNLDTLHALLRGNKQEREVSEAVQVAVSRLVKDCSLDLPVVDPVRHSETTLDINLRRRRRRELDEVKKAMQNLDISDSQQAVAELESVLIQLENLAQEPQTSVPDVFLWLMSGTRRLAYIRIPAHSVLHAHDPMAQGTLSGKFNTYALTNPDDDSRWGLGGVVRASVWLGREEELRTWWDARTDLQLTVYAETYENQVVSVPGSGKWNDSGLLMTRPKFSDADGLLNLPPDAFTAPEGWTFQGEWFVDPDPSLRFAADAGRQLFTEEVFEQQMRLPGGTWVAAPSSWTDVRNDTATARDEVGLPEGWAWRDLWAYDLQRAVDGEGWEYTVETGLMGWSPQERIYHTRRRRRWIRERHLVQKVKKKETVPVDGWEYAPLFRLQFHAIERKVDMVRRRRWRRRLVPSQPGLPPTPRLSITTGKGDEKYPQLTCPRMYLMSAERHQYQLRAHIYQARDLIPGDKTGLADPYAVVSFCNGTQQTEKQMKTLCPTWDQTLIFDDVLLSGHVEAAATQAPSVVVEVFDWDARGAPEYLGRVFCRPSVVVPSSEYKPLPLQWYQLAQGNEKQGELLASFELLLKDGEEELPMLPPTRLGGDLYMVPFGVRPLLQKTRVEILCWGVRNMTTYELQSITRPSIEFECGGERIISPTMKNLRINPNFDKPHLVFDVELPKEALYMPPLTLRVVDHRAFGSKPVVATAVVCDLQRYTVEPKAVKRKRKNKKSTLGQRESLSLGSLTALDSKTFTEKPGTVDVDIDWWAKYYASCGQLERAGSYLVKGYERLEVLPGTLEDEARFSGFKDMVDIIPLYRGRGDNAQLAGEFKGTFRMYPLSSEEPDEPPLILAGYPPSDLQEVVARVYVVMGQDLAPKDAGCSSDPYVVVKLGKTTKSSKDDYRPNTLNPIFGHVFEVTGTLPLHKDLTVQVWDRDLITSDDLIGETVIDLENRYLTRHRCTVGLARQYHVSGSNMWRDVQLPSEILAKVARERNLEGPLWQQQPFSLTLGGTTYTLTEFEHPDVVLPPTVGNPRERLALHVLHKAVPLVPEHVENRSLMHPGHPGIPQGQLRLWVDIFPSSAPSQSLPPPVDITPRQPHKYMLRVVVFNVFEAPLQEMSVVGGEKMSDVYVKGWLQGTNNVQKTDTHYRCMDGEANFNWRFVFPLEMLEAEQVMLVEYKEHPWSLSSTQQRRPPQLTLQLWDNDLILRDDYLSEMTLDLCHLPKPAKSTKGVGPAQVPQMMGNGTSNSVAISFLDDHSTSVNLFEAKRVYGYFPFTTVEDGVTTIAGKIEMELEVVSEEDSKQRPAGLGRDEPNMNPKLPEPNRPATSFLWLSSPWKSFRHILWKNYKWYCITLVVLIILFLFLFLFLYSFPGATVEYLMGTY